MSRLEYGEDTVELLKRLGNIKDDTLDVSHLKINSLPELPTTIKKLHCSYTQLEYLPALPECLEVLDCMSVPLKELPRLPSNLKKMYCYYTNIQILPHLPPNLEALYCCFNESLHTIRNFSDSLKIIWCYHNPKLETIPELPSKLEELSCHTTPISSLPGLTYLSNKLKKLVCSNTNIKRLPVYFPDSIEILSCPKSCLEAMFGLPKNLKQVWCNGYLVIYKSKEIEIIKNMSMFDEETDDYKIALIRRL